MASSQPIVRQSSFLQSIPQMVAFALILVVLHDSFGLNDALLYAPMTFVGLSYALKMAIPRNHRKGIRLVKQKSYVEAIAEFQKSLDFFERNSWIDRYRSIVLLSSSRISYTEMALLNLSFCYSQIGNGRQAKALYERTLAMFPNSQIAIAALNLIASSQSN